MSIRAACRRLAPAAAIASALAATAFAAPDRTRRGPLCAGDAAARTAEAAELRAKDVRALGAALTALGDAASAADGDVEFLTGFIAAEPSRALRVLAIESAQRVDATAAAENLLERAKTEKDAARAAACVEALGLLGTKERAPALIELLADAPDLVALAAADALARLGVAADVPAIAERALRREWQVVADHCGWAALDLVGDRVKATNAFLPKGGDAPPIRVEARIAGVAALLAEDGSAPHRWTSPLPAAGKALRAAPRTVPVRALNPEMETWLEAGVAWLEDMAPADYWLVCASLKSISYTSGATRLDAAAGRLDLSYTDAGLPPEKLACLIFRQASIAWRKRVGEPWTGRRAWDAAIADSYDLCALGGVDGAGRGAAARERFLDRAVALCPWVGK